jgi:hypothetical protein
MLKVLTARQAKGIVFGFGIQEAFFVENNELFLRHKEFIQTTFNEIFNLARQRYRGADIDFEGERLLLLGLFINLGYDTILKHDTTHHISW